MASRLRPARPDEAAALAAFQRRAYRHYVPRIGAEPQPMQADYAAILRDDMVWVADGADGRLAALVLRAMPDHLLVWSVAVDPDRQSRGWGRRLMAFAEERARAMGRTEMRLYTNEKFTENRAFYARLGYVETSTDVLDGRTLVHMRKILKGA